MGAFGRLLIQRWGGDLAAYDGHSSPSKPVASKEKSNEEMEEHDEEIYQRISDYSEEYMKKGENMLKHLMSNELLLQFKTEKGMAKYEKWVNKFMNKLEE